MDFNCSPSSSAATLQSPNTVKSPVALSRIQEKNQLASLNDRLADYIDRNRHLENQNANISRQLAKSEETTSMTVTRLRDTYDKELVTSRGMIDEMAKERARLDLENNLLRKNFQDTKKQLDKKIKEAAAIAKSLRDLDSRFQDLAAQHNKIGSERDELIQERKQLQDELHNSQKTIETLRRKLDRESLQRSDLESQLNTKTKELNFKVRCHEQEVTEIRARRNREMQEVDGLLQQEYELRLQQSIQELRAEFEGQLRNNKDELCALYEQTVADLKAQLQRVQSSSQSKSDEMVSLTTRYETLTKSLTTIESEKQGLMNKIKELEKRNDLDHGRFVNLLSERDAEIDQLMDEKSALLTEYQSLMDTKVALDNEITTYHKLLDGAERRLDLKRVGEKASTIPVVAKKPRTEDDDDDETFHLAIPCCSSEGISVINNNSVETIGIEDGDSPQISSSQDDSSEEDMECIYDNIRLY